MENLTDMPKGDIAHAPDSLTSEAARNLARARQIVSLTCTVCGKATNGTKKRRYCSHACQQRAYYMRSRNTSPQTTYQSDEARSAEEPLSTQEAATTLLIVDDDTDLLDVLTYVLRREGYNVVGATNSLQALDSFHTHHPNLVILDDFETFRRIRHSSDVPIIMLAASQEERDVSHAFQVGVDDYMTKPFSIKELEARIRTILGRPRSEQHRRVPHEVRVGDLVLRQQSYEVTRGEGAPIQLRPLEFRILYMLAMNEGQIIPYARLVDYVWSSAGGNAKILKTHISHIRRRLGLPLKGPGAIQSLASVGYKLVKKDSNHVTAPEPPLLQTFGEQHDDLAVDALIPVHHGAS